MTWTVLVCDNEQAIRQLVADSLQGVCEVAQAVDGVEGIELARSLRPDLVLLDMRMPRMDGLDVLRALRADAELGAMPVIMLTASAQSRDEAAAEAVGVNRFVTKPFSPLALVDVVRDVLAEAQV